MRISKIMNKLLCSSDIFIQSIACSKPKFTLFILKYCIHCILNETSWIHTIMIKASHFQCFPVEYVKSITSTYPKNSGFVFKD